MSGTGAAARVAVDALGGDHGPRVVVEGAVAAARELGVSIQLIGPQEIVGEELRRANGADLPITLHDAPEAVGMGEKLSRATLKKRSSILVGLERLRDGQADAFFSAGNTAVCWTIAKLTLGLLPEVDRPALAAVVPNRIGHTVLIDVGANAHCKARHLEEFAVMGKVYARAVLRMANPRVGLMSMGEEETKGTELTKEVFEVLKGSSLNFVGNVEGHDVFTGKVDVIVMDGYTGNVLLKASESLAESILYLIREEIGASARTKLGAWLSRPAFRRVRQRIDASEYGGAPLLGVRGCCVIGHGRSSAYAIKHGVRAAADFFTSGVNDRIEEEVRLLIARPETASVTTA